ncbi:MAG: FAD-binding protein, partial [Deltaproteobacteria bacterium]|nr:FAD-binding protein [Deltaproteobacteria bacterium]
MKVNIIKTDVLIIGAGGAGARAALEAAQTAGQVTLVCRSPLGRGGLTPTANGGYHAAVWPGDSPAIHAEDLITMGCNLNDRNLVAALSREALEQAQMLEKFGAAVNWDVPPKPQEPQMRYPRSLFVPGREVLAALNRQLKKCGNVLILADHLALQLLTVAGKVTGAVLLNIAAGSITVCLSKTTVMATGSLGEIYPRSAQEPMGLPTGSTGSGYVLAGLAGADLVDMEMIQFAAIPLEPTLIIGMRCLPWAPVKNAAGREFLPPEAGEYSHEAAQAVYREISAGRGPLTMDLRDRTPVAHFRHPLFGQRSRRLQEFGVTPFQRPVTVGVGALFMMGGIHINERCETSVPGLYAAGEVSGNVHGARRVSGNAFPEMIVFGARAGKYAALEAGKDKAAPEVPQPQIEEAREYLSSLVAGLVQGPGEGRPGGTTPREVRQKTRQIMEKYGNLIRNGEGLRT